MGESGGCGRARIGHLRVVMVVGSTSCLRGSRCVSYQVSQLAATIVPSALPPRGWLLEVLL